MSPAAFAPAPSPLPPAGSAADLTGEPEPSALLASVLATAEMLPETRDARVLLVHIVGQSGYGKTTALRGLVRAAGTGVLVSLPIERTTEPAFADVQALIEYLRVQDTVTRAIAEGEAAQAALGTPVHAPGDAPQADALVVALDEPYATIARGGDLTALWNALQGLAAQGPATRRIVLAVTTQFANDLDTLLPGAAALPVVRLTLETRIGRHLAHLLGRGRLVRAQHHDPHHEPPHGLQAGARPAPSLPSRVRQA